jgi:integrase
MTMANKIDTVSARDKLDSRREQYWHRLSKGCYLGFRKMTDDSSGTWWARYRTDDGKQVAHGLGALDEHPAHLRFDKAKILADDWLKHVGIGGSVVAITVKEACADYVEKIRREKGDTAADELASRYRRWIDADPIAKIELTKLTREHVKKYRIRLSDAPVTINKGGETRSRAKDTINRDMTAVRAALNSALADGRVTTDFAWREVLKPIKNAGNRRDLYLDRNQRINFIEHAADDLAQFLRGLALLPLRPGALAALTVADFDKRLGALKVGKDKHGQNRTIRLPEQTAAMFTTAARDKLPAAPLLSRADGKAWNKDSWKWPVKSAAKAAGLPTETTAYALRHSVITDLVHGGLDLLTVAQISGTSVSMIEKHYGHMRNDVASLALAKLTL